MLVEPNKKSVDVCGDHVTSNSNMIYLAILRKRGPFWGDVKWSFQGISDLHLGDQKVTGVVKWPFENGEFKWPPTFGHEVWSRLGHHLVVGGWTNPFEKICESQNGFIFPQFSGESQKCLSCHHLVLLENLGLISLSFRWIIEEFMDFIKWSYFDLFLSKNCFCKNYSGSVSYPLPVTQYPFLNWPRQATGRCTRRWTGNSDHRRWWDVASPCLRQNSDEVHNNNLHSPSLTWNLKIDAFQPGLQMLVFKVNHVKL